MNTQISYSNIPTVLLTALSKPESVCSPRISTLTSEDPLPAVVKINSSGYLLSHQTRFTAVERETTDDN